MGWTIYHKMRWESHKIHCGENHERSQVLTHPHAGTWSCEKATGKMNICTLWCNLKYVRMYRMCGIYVWNTSSWYHLYVLGRPSNDDHHVTCARHIPVGQIGGWPMLAMAAMVGACNFCSSIGTVCNPLKRTNNSAKRSLSYRCFFSSVSQVCLCLNLKPSMFIQHVHVYIKHHQTIQYWWNA